MRNQHNSIQQNYVLSAAAKPQVGDVAADEER